MNHYQPSNTFSLGPILSAIVFVHLLAVVGLILFPPTWGILFATALIVYFQGIGITMVYHRCLTHRSFDFRNRWLERIFVTLGTLAFQDGPIWWCSLHRIHHRISDTPNDPHNSRRGFLYSHIIWLGYLDKRWKIPSRVHQFSETVKDISADRYYQWLDRFYYIPFIIFLGLLYFLGGWTFFFWGGAVATVVQWHFTFSINSFTHLFGYRSFNTNDTSTNFWPVAYFTMGEGWHNNHHAYPSSAKSGFFKWWEFDFTYLIILFLFKIKLIKNLKTPGNDQLEI